MAMPSGDSPKTRSSSTTICTASNRPTRRSQTWHVDWLVARLDVGLRDRARRRDPALVGLAVPHDSPPERASIPVDSLGGYTTEAGRARPPPSFSCSPRSSSCFARRADRRPSRLRADVLMAVAALPFVSYSSLTEAVVPAADWPTVYASLQALKGHVQEYPGCQRFDVFVARRGERETCACTATRRGTRPSSSRSFLERGYTFERLLDGCRRGSKLDAEPRHGEDLLMARTPKAPRPARPLFGYRDIGEDASATRRRAIRRAWVDPRDPDRLLSGRGR